VRLLEVGIKNFKSLRDVTFKPGDLSVLIGPNGAGKSNLCDALDFIGEIYRTGLDEAIMERGGFERLRFRDGATSGAEISVSVVASLASVDLKAAWKQRSGQPVPAEVVIYHTLTVRGQDRDHDAAYHIGSESLHVDVRPRKSSKARALLSVTRSADGDIGVIASDYARQILPPLVALSDEAIRELTRSAAALGPTRILPAIAQSVLLPIVPVTSTLGAIGLYRLDPLSLRAPGIPQPRPMLRRDGANVAAVLDWLKDHDPRAYSGAVQNVQTVWPTLDEIDIVRTPLNGIQLHFQEAGCDQPWTVHDVSDGTLRALGLFTTIFDPRINVIVVDEPESSLHPWAVWRFIEVCRELAETKQLILTTHSLDLMDLLRPEEIWIVSKGDGSTNVDPLNDLHPAARSGWEQGHFMLSEYIDTGLVPGSVPAITR
jgi:predicted ATPase